ncbi:Hypothetical predicted protein [Octopus vulgaris]|uniref:Uncharacterized protein n=1 Tax=Octopus vulgaris TaxID=6645 RepID=A0AA36F2R8_OCTVU|nr:Hypothetical predicted protein [Octopus vulgaris]
MLSVQTVVVRNANRSDHVYTDYFNDLNEALQKYEYSLRLSDAIFTKKNSGAYFANLGLINMHTFRLKFRNSTGISISSVIFVVFASTVGAVLDVIVDVPSNFETDAAISTDAACRCCTAALATARFTVAVAAISAPVACDELSLMLLEKQYH